MPPVIDPRWQRPPRGPRSRTVPGRKLSRVERRAGERLPAAVEPLPATRGDCVDGERPCPFLRCKYHLYLDVNEETGSIKLNFPGRDLDELVETCALDVADRGGMPLIDVATMLNVTRQRILQLQVRSLRALATELGGEGPTAKRYRAGRGAR